MKGIRFGSHMGRSTTNNASVRDSRDTRTYPTPAEFVAQVGRVLTVCFGLALLAHVIVALVGAAGG